MVAVKNFLLFSKYLSGPERQVQSLDKNRYPLLSGDGTQPWGGGAAAAPEPSAEGERLLLPKGCKDDKTSCFL